MSLLERPTLARRESLASGPKSEAAHREALTSLPALNRVEVGGHAGLDRLAPSFTVGAWNLERCLDPEGSAAVLVAEGCDVVLLSEMDCGMSRTAQRHTTAVMADLLGMTYVYGVEFLELDLGTPTEQPFCTDPHNDAGFHGNAILSKVPLIDPRLIRLCDYGHWFGGRAVNGTEGQARVGGRMALIAGVETEAGPVVVVSTHLESNADAAHRDRQMVHLMDEAEAYAEGRPILIGGDLNTGNFPDDFDWRNETLFETAKARGFHWDANPEGYTTRVSRITLTQPAPKKLDWFCARGLSSSDGAIVPALDPTDTALSDHELIRATFQRSS